MLFSYRWHCLGIISCKNQGTGLVESFSEVIIPIEVSPQFLLVFNTQSVLFNHLFRWCGLGGECSSRLCRL